MMRIAFFDFDGTITYRDSMLDFIRYAKGDLRFAVGMILLFPMLISYKLGRISRHRAKELFLSHFFKGMRRKALQDIADAYSLTRIAKILRPETMEEFRRHLKQNDKVVVVSASVDIWLRAWCRKNGVELIATRLEYTNNRFAGRLFGENCRGREKVLRILEKFDLTLYSSIYAYGDSDGDDDMLALAHVSVRV